MRIRPVFLFCFLVSCLLAIPCVAQSGKGQLRVVTSPAGASVTCDGILRDQSPVELVELDPGDHLVQVELSGYLPERRTVSVASGRKAAVEIIMNPIKGLALIKTIPDGGNIQVDGAHRGTAPLLITDLTIGRYRIRGSAGGYQDREVELTIENRTPRCLVLELPSDSSTLTVNSVPPGATISINGLSRGTTPCTLERLQSGETKISLNLADHLPYQDTITLEAGETHNLDVSLKPLPSTLSLVSVPAGAKVFVDDQVRGVTPLSLESIEPGTHTIRMELDGYEPQTRSLEIQRRETRVEEFTMLRLTGHLEVLTDQGGVSLFVDGAEKAVIPDVEKPTEPIQMELAIGNHRVELRKKGYLTVDKRILITQGEVFKVRESLKRHFQPDTVVKLNSGESVIGVAGRRFPDGDLEVETRPGIYRTLKASEIVSVDAYSPPAR